MKFLALLLTTFFVSTFLFGQISIDQQDFMTAGDTVRISFTEDPSIDFASSGPNMTWNFSNLIASSQQLVSPQAVAVGGLFVEIVFNSNNKWKSDYFIDFLDLPLDQVGGFLPINIENVYQFHALSPDSNFITGLSILAEGNNIPFRSDTIEVTYPLPLTFGDSYTSRGYTKADFNPFFDGVFIQYRERNTVVDGHGTLITPFNTFDAIRMHHVIDEVDSFYFDLGFGATWFPLTVPRRHFYEWWAKGEKLPVFSISTVELNGSETITSISYRDLYLGLDASTEEAQLGQTSCFPNPTNGNLVINTPFPMQLCKVINSSGKVCRTIEVDLKTSINLDLNDLSTGVYIISIQGAGQNEVLRVIKD
ncbi:MAG: T9SS type A sorting domain-containing protein [Crocinitomicaceae bacterium]|nr:T9SS type A sorting domain-containing protein [Crocinitomicaceae bacterium]